LSSHIENLEKRLGIETLSAFLETDIYPRLKTVKVENTKPGSMPRALQWPLIGTFIATIIIHQLVSGALPDQTWMDVVMTLMFPVIFLGLLAVVLYFFLRDRLAALLLDGKARFLIRADIFNQISGRLGIDYIAVPGGPPKFLRSLAHWKHCPAVLKDAVSVMDAHSGIEDVADIIRNSGLAMPRGTVLGTQEQREKYYEQQLDVQQFEDGFRGVRSGIAFAALEWRESFNDSTLHHLLIAMKIPTRLTGIVELKSRKEDWPMIRKNVEFKSVSLISKVFKKKFDLRATDQMEGRLVFDPAVIERANDLSHDNNIRAVAYEDNLVFDVSGDNRFEIVDLVTGAWSEDSVLQSLTDIAEMLELVDQVGHVFSVKKTRQA